MVGGPKKGWEKRPAAAGGGFLTWKISFFFWGVLVGFCYEANIPTHPFFSVSMSFFLGSFFLGGDSRRDIAMLSICQW